MISIRDPFRAISSRGPASFALTVAGKPRTGYIPAIGPPESISFISPPSWTPGVSLSIAADTLDSAYGFRVLLIFPSVQAKTAVSRFDHGQILLPAQAVWEGLQASGVVITWRLRSLVLRDRQGRPGRADVRRGRSTEGRRCRCLHRDEERAPRRRPYFGPALEPASEPR
jgi:hypothetical protein